MGTQWVGPYGEEWGLRKGLWDSGRGPRPRATLLGRPALYPIPRPLPPVGTSILEDPQAGKTSTLVIAAVPWGSPWPLPSSAPPVLAGAACSAQSCGAGVGWGGCIPGPLAAGLVTGGEEVQPSSSQAGHLSAVSDRPSAALPVPPGSSSSRVVFTHQHPPPDSAKPCMTVTSCPEPPRALLPPGLDLCSRGCGCHRSLLGLSQGLTMTGSPRAAASSRLPG